MEEHCVRIAEVRDWIPSQAWIDSFSGCTLYCLSVGIKLWWSFTFISISSSNTSYSCIYIILLYWSITIIIFCLVSQEDKEKWVQFHKRKWEFQAKQRAEKKRLRKEADTLGISTLAVGRGPSTAMSNFMRQQARSVLDTPWKIIQVKLRGNHGQSNLLLISR